MPINNTSSKELFQKIKKLNLPIGEYALFGSAPMAVRELKEAEDIDIIASEKLWRELSQKEEWGKKLSKYGDEYFFDDKIEIYKNWRPGDWDINELIGTAEIIDGLPFVGLENIIKWKKIYGREKDLRDIEIIENFLRNK